ncbi:MAG: diaminopimelate epimerase [Burkholderiaceae bacterium]
MQLRFTKMHGAGNDFVMLNGVTQPIELTAAQYRALASRHFGVGADQVLLVEPVQEDDAPDIDFRYRIFNSDGNEVEHCGNGARCFVRFVRDQNLSDKQRLRVKTMNGVIEPQLLDDGNVTVDMGAPRFDLQAVPFNAAGLTAVPCGESEQWPVSVDGQTRLLAVASMGNPHAMQIVDDVDQAPVTIEGPLIVGHERFPQGVNAAFMQIISRGSVRLRVYERGAGETLACGTGACAAVAMGIRLGLLDQTVDLQARGGSLRLQWSGLPDASIFMTGNAVKVYEGEIDLNTLPTH